MKVKVLTRRPEDFVRETKDDIHKVHRNYRLLDNIMLIFYNKLKVLNKSGVKWSKYLELKI